MAHSQAPATDLVRMERIVKRFGDNVVLRAVDFDVRWGEVHALLGGNGAGKSTLMKVLMGVHKPDEGRIFVEGEDMTGAGIGAHLHHGVAMIFQELSLLPNLTVAQNLFFGREPLLPGRRIDGRRIRKEARRLLDERGFDIAEDMRVEDLPFAQRQLIEILKVASYGARVIIMDEPTSSLTLREEEKLFELIKELTGQGIGIVYISHRMSEIMRVSDRITVLRDGRTLGPIAAAEANIDEISAYLTGERAEEAKAPTRSARQSRREGQPPPLSVSGLSTSRTLKGVDLSVKAGEIVGIAGLVGSGRSTLAKAISGLLADAEGKIEVGGRLVPTGKAGAILGAGLGFVPEDRRLEGLVIEHSLLDNLALPNLSKLARGLLFPSRMDRAREMFRRSTEGLSLVASGPDQVAAELSGGNQQKIVVAKWLASEPSILILDEPTSGVDVGAKRDMRAEIRRRVDRDGLGVLLINSELDELIAACDRILIMEKGRFVHEVDPSAGESVLQAILLNSTHSTKRNEEAV